ncbi:uncharacterized protein LOC121377599 [Gigantopelta aegis]|uniref:uncharacterized protein LOC121377599 n=1 Tax=Gigantopelta aegis TaxID=1735272 RepID=UPI001B88E67A|nr:uncharacterized protein LOC121377599 [Gigantopelta aegis]
MSMAWISTTATTTTTTAAALVLSAITTLISAETTLGIKATTTTTTTTTTQPGCGGYVRVYYSTFVTSFYGRNTLTSPGYNEPGYYGNNLHCTWHLRAPIDSVVMIQALNVSMGPCRYDNVTIIDGKSAENPVMGTWCTTPFRYYTSSTRHMLVVLRTTVNERRHRGFVIRAKYLDLHHRVIVPGSSSHNVLVIATVAVLAFWCFVVLCCHLKFNRTKQPRLEPRATTSSTNSNYAGNTPTTTAGRSAAAATPATATEVATPALMLQPPAYEDIIENRPPDYREATKLYSRSGATTSSANDDDVITPTTTTVRSATMATSATVAKSALISQPPAYEDLVKTRPVQTFSKEDEPPPGYRVAIELYSMCTVHNPP